MQWYIYSVGCRPSTLHNTDNIQLEKETGVFIWLGLVAHVRINKKKSPGKNITINYYIISLNPLKYHKTFFGMNRIHPNNETFNLLYNNEVLSELTFEHIHTIHIYPSHLYDSPLNTWKKISHTRTMYNMDYSSTLYIVFIF